MPPLDSKTMGREIQHMREQSYSLKDAADHLRGKVTVAVADVAAIAADLETFYANFVATPGDANRRQAFDKFKAKFDELKGIVAQLEAAVAAAAGPAAHGAGHGGGHGAAAHGSGHGGGHHGTHRPHYHTMSSLVPEHMTAGGVKIYKQQEVHPLTPYKAPEVAKPVLSKWEAFKKREINFINIRNAGFRTLGVLYKGYGIASGDKAWMDVVSIPVVGILLPSMLRDWAVTHKFDYSDKNLEFNDLYAYLRGKYQTHVLPKELKSFIDNLSEHFEKVEQTATVVERAAEFSARKIEIGHKYTAIKEKISAATFLDQNAKELLLARLEQVVGSFKEDNLAFDKAPLANQAAIDRRKAIQDAEKKKRTDLKEAAASYMIAKVQGATIVRDWVNFGASVLTGKMSVALGAAGAVHAAGKAKAHIDQNKMMREPRPHVAKPTEKTKWINDNAPKGPISWIADMKGSVVKTFDGLARTLAQGFVRFGPTEAATGKQLDYRSGRPLTERDRIQNFKDTLLRTLMIVGIPLVAFSDYQNVDEAISGMVHQFDRKMDEDSPQKQRWMENIDARAVDNSPSAVDVPYYAGPLPTKPAPRVTAPSAGSGQNTSHSVRPDSDSSAVRGGGAAPSELPPFYIPQIPSSENVLAEIDKMEKASAASKVEAAAPAKVVEADLLKDIESSHDLIKKMDIENKDKARLENFRLVLQWQHEMYGAGGAAIEGLLKAEGYTTHIADADLKILVTALAANHEQALKQFVSDVKSGKSYGIILDHLSGKMPGYGKLVGDPNLQFMNMDLSSNSGPNHNKFKEVELHRLKKECRILQVKAMADMPD